MFVEAAPSLAGQVALELMRSADESARPVIDAALDAIGMLAGQVGDARRAVRPLAGFLSDPAGWLRSADALGNQPVKVQALFDALRPLLGLAGGPGDPIVLFTGVTLSVGAEGDAIRIEVAADSSAFAPPQGATGRLIGGVTAALVVGASGRPGAGTGRAPWPRRRRSGPASDPRVPVDNALSTSSCVPRPAPTSPCCRSPGWAAWPRRRRWRCRSCSTSLPRSTATSVTRSRRSATVSHCGPGPSTTDTSTGRRSARGRLNPVGKLTDALPSLLDAGLTALAQPLDGIVPQRGQRHRDQQRAQRRRR